MTNETTKRAHRNTVEQIVWQEAVSRTQYVYKGEAVKDGQEVIDYLLAEVASILETQNISIREIEEQANDQVECQEGSAAE